MKQSLYLLVLIFVALTIVSCKTNFQIQIYRFCPIIDTDIYTDDEVRKIIFESDVKVIMIKNDSIIGYSKRYGGIYSNTEIKYIIVNNNELITDSVNFIGYEIPSMTNMRFLYSRDSLINKLTNERYYNQKYLDKIYCK